MTPNKKIYNHSFLHGLGDLNLESVEVTTGTRRLRTTWTQELSLDVSTFNNIDAEVELTTLLSQQITEEINRELLENIRDYTIAQDLVPMQPMDAPQGNLFYFDYNYGPIEEPVVYDDGSWSMGNTFDGVIGIKSEIKQHTLI